MRHAKFSSAAGLLTSLVLICSTTVYVSCDSTARIFLRLVQFDRLQVVGVTPVKSVVGAQGETYVPACGGDATHVRINFNLKSTQRQTAQGETADKDLQIRPNVPGSPGDAIGKSTVQLGKTVSAANFSTSLACVGTQGGNDTAGTCNGNTTASSTVQDLEFVDNLQGAGRRTPIGVALVIDQSGSTSGLVDGTQFDGQFSPTCLEAKPGAAEQPKPLNLCASDDKNLRLSAAKDFIGLLNSEDPAIVFQFSEDVGTNIVCELPGVDQPDEATKAENCYTAERRFTLGGFWSDDIGTLPSALDSLQGRGKGRSNLWAAVDKAFKFMSPRQQRARHIVVITDGPDTCDPGSANFQHCFQLSDSGIDFDPAAQEGCPGSVPYASARQSVMDYLSNLGSRANDVHVSFVHFQSKGYAQPDPRMEEIACLTGGQYIFINSNNIGENSGERKVAITDAVTKIRYTLGGYWGLITDIPAYSQDGNANATRGEVAALEGTLKMTANAMVNKDVIEDFGFGNANRDNRLSLAKPCRDDTDCATGAGTDPCGIRCDPGSRTCVTPPPGSVCGTNGICCQGACAEGQKLCTTPAEACP